MSIHCLLVCIISDVISALITSIPLYAMCVLSLDTLKVVSLFSVLHILNMMSVGFFLFFLMRWDFLVFSEILSFVFVFFN